MKTNALLMDQRDYRRQDTGKDPWRCSQAEWKNFPLVMHALESETEIRPVGWQDWNMKISIF
jgi:hypothetical protein